MKLDVEGNSLLGNKLTDHLEVLTDESVEHLAKRLTRSQCRRVHHIKPNTYKFIDRVLSKFNGKSDILFDCDSILLIVAPGGVGNVAPR
jgi:hypothetical protein